MPISSLAPCVRRPAGLPMQVYASVTESIAGGGLHPGERIVVEHLAQQLGVSQTPVREALGRLIREGLVMEGLNGRLSVVRLTPAYVFETFLVRGALEGLAAELAAPRFSDEQLLELSSAMEKVDVALRLHRFDVYSRFDDHLHRSICEVAENDVLSRELHPLQIHVDFIRQYSRQQAGEHITLSHEEHRSLVDALCSRDTRTSRDAMETHIRNASQRIEELIDFQGAESITMVGPRQASASLERGRGAHP